MKHKRLSKILELIEAYPIETQEELAEKLKECGFLVTQATISRDIKELRLIKVGTEGERYRYAVMSPSEIGLGDKLKTIISHGVVRAETALNLVVVKTLAGMAQAVAMAVDSMSLKEIVGTIAGDDTFMIACKTEADAEKVLKQLKKYM